MYIKLSVLSVSTFAILKEVWLFHHFALLFLSEHIFFSVFSNKVLYEFIKGMTQNEIKLKQISCSELIDKYIFQLLLNKIKVYSLIKRNHNSISSIFVTKCFKILVHKLTKQLYAWEQLMIMNYNSCESSCWNEAIVVINVFPVLYLLTINCSRLLSWRRLCFLWDISQY